MKVDQGSCSMDCIIFEVGRNEKSFIEQEWRPYATEYLAESCKASTHLKISSCNTTLVMKGLAYRLQ